MRTETIIRIVIIVAWIISVVVAVRGDSLYLIAGSSAAAFGLLAWLGGLGDAPSVSSKKRAVSYVCSFIPGLGHLYLGRWKRSIPFLMMIVVILLSLYLLFLYPPDADYIAVIMLLLTIMYGSHLSWADVEKLCDDMGLSYDNEPIIHKKHPYSYHYIVTFFASVIAVSVTIFYVFFDWNPDRIIWIYATTGLAWSIGLCISTIYIGQRILSRKKDMV